MGMTASSIAALLAGVLIQNPALAGAPTADGYSVELIHPQSDDQGHYVSVPYLTRTTVFGAVGPGGEVRAVTVNGKKARVFPARMPPFGVAAETPALEFRATLQIRPTSAIEVVVESGTGVESSWSAEANTRATISRLRQLAVDNPDDARGRCRLGNALKDQNRLNEAIAEFREALARRSDCAYMRVELGRALLAVGRPEEAIGEFAMATEIDPDDAMAWLNLGLVHARYTPNTAEAARCFRRYLALEPSSSTADKVRRYLARVSP